MITSSVSRKQKGPLKRHWLLLLVTLIVLSAAFLLSYLIFANDLAIDKALDAGGNWDYENNRPNR
jgi:hypothetical protein